VCFNNASIAEREGETKTTGDPMEVALLIAGTKGGIDRDEPSNRRRKPAKFPSIRRSK